jgi:ribosomal 50S subunit-recycling heat shock protein
VRLDVFLKQSRLVKRRSLAKELCDEGAVAVNGVRARPGRDVVAGDRLSVRLWNRIMEIEVQQIPSRPPLGEESRSLYLLLAERRVDGDGD